MAKLSSSFRNMTIVLTLVCMVSSLLLASVYALTKSEIDAAQSKKQREAIERVSPQGEGEPIEKMVQLGDNSYQTYTILRSGEIVGYVVKSYTTKGFSGRIELMVGFDAGGAIYKTYVLSHSETPGLGAKMTLESFSSQFEGKSSDSFRLMVKKDGGDVDAITASTITSRAYCDAVSVAVEVYKKLSNNSNKQ